MAPMEVSKHLKIRFFIYFSEKFFEGLVIPFFIIYASKELSAALLGAALVAITFLSTISGLWGGYIADFLGRRRILLSAELLKTLTLFLLSLLVFKKYNISFALTVYLAVQIMASILSAVSEAVTLDILKPEQFKQAYSTLYWLNNLGRSTGTILGVILYEGYGFYSLPFLCALFSSISTLLIATQMKETQSLESYSLIHQKGFLNQYKKTLSDKNILIFLLANILHFSIALQLTYYVAMRLSLEFPQQKLLTVGGYVLLINALQIIGVLRLQTNFMVILLNRWTQKIAQPLKLTTIFTIFPLLAATNFSIIMVSNSAWKLIFCMAIYTFSEMIYLPALHALLPQFVPEHARAKYSSIKSLDLRVAMLVSSMFVFLADFFPPTTLAYMIIAIGVTMVLFLLKLLKNLNEVI
ncbi:MAG: MFS transporter [Neisseriaceae bacterium]